MPLRRTIYLAKVHVPVMLLHGSADNVVPPTETLWLEHDLPPGVLRAALISPAIGHVEVGGAGTDGQTAADPLDETDAGPAGHAPAPSAVEADGTDMITLANLREAQARLKDVAVHTPLVRYFGGNADRAKCGEEFYLKAESLQPIGSFKLRGAYNKIASLTAAERARGVITYSSGNHAQGVAYAARVAGSAGP